MARTKDDVAYELALHAGKISQLTGVSLEDLADFFKKIRSTRAHRVLSTKCERIRSVRTIATCYSSGREFPRERALECLPSKSMTAAEVNAFFRQYDIPLVVSDKLVPSYLPHPNPPPGGAPPLRIGESLMRVFTRT